MSSLETTGLQQDKTPEIDLQTCAAKQLSCLGIPGLMTLEAIEFQLLELDSVLANSQQLAEQYKPLIANLPTALHSCFQVSAAGVEQLATMIQLLQSTPEAMWTFRDTCFNDYEMDFRLAKLQQQLTILTPLNKKLVPFVATNALGTTSSLRAIQTCLDNAGMFCWFSADWRKAKKETLALAVNEQLKLADIKMLFPAMIKYVNAQENHDAIFAEIPALSMANQGINTDLVPLLAVREWYKDVGFAITAHFAGEGEILTGLSVLAKEDADVLVATYADKLMTNIKVIDNQMNKLRLSFPECQILKQGDVSYLTSVAELKTIVVTQLNILKNGCNSTNVCLADCK
ncbi:hypothetical protein HWV00_10815 [Moritella sp. 24]|uniref:hypothetical protein n=1 Tax=Moritella sp. 24 TaxID=2746230 RepID=UPI001BAA5DF8|nr:hypothetical protein [Moritella sp. 24]QUM76681.1 hypothetical protein HWV00_10815 [Moritella sp. 24]